MSIDDTNAKLRGQQEIVKGKVVDKQGVHLDDTAIENALLKAASGQSHVADEEDVTLSADAEHIDGKMVDEDGVHLSKDDLLASLMPLASNKMPKAAAKKGKETQKTASIDLGMYQPVWDELQKIPFSENHEQEMKIITSAIKEAAMEFKVKKIIANTKAVAKNAEKFFYSGNTVRIVFSILGNKFSMAAVGDFTGREAFYIQVLGDNLAGQILRMEDDGEVSDVTKKYKIGIQKA
jgi:hypothetical protein